MAMQVRKTQSAANPLPPEGYSPPEIKTGFAHFESAVVNIQTAVKTAISSGGKPSDDSARLQSWLESFTSRCQDPSLTRVQKKGKKRTVVNKVFASYLKIGDEWGDCEDTKNEYLSRQKRSQEQREKNSDSVSLRLVPPPPWPNPRPPTYEQLFRGALGIRVRHKLQLGMNRANPLYVKESKPPWKEDEPLHSKMEKSARSLERLYDAPNVGDDRLDYRIGLMANVGHCSKPEHVSYHLRSVPFQVGFATYNYDEHTEIAWLDKSNENGKPHQWEPMVMHNEDYLAWLATPRYMHLKQMTVDDDMPERLGLIVRQSDDELRYSRWLVEWSSYNAPRAAVKPKPLTRSKNVRLDFYKYLYKCGRISELQWAKMRNSLLFTKTFVEKSKLPVPVGEPYGDYEIETKINLVRLENQLSAELHNYASYADLEPVNDEVYGQWTKEPDSTDMVLVSSLSRILTSISIDEKVRRAGEYTYKPKGEYTVLGKRITQSLTPLEINREDYAYSASGLLVPEYMARPAGQGIEDQVIVRLKPDETNSPRPIPVAELYAMC
jgi:hypothetical protein